MAKRYTPEEARARHIQQATKHAAMKTTINVRIWPMQKARLKAYADHMGLDLATMLQACAERCIMADNWTWEPTPEDIELIKADAEARRAKALGTGD